MANDRWRADTSMACRHDHGVALFLYLRPQLRILGIKSPPALLPELRLDIRHVPVEPSDHFFQEEGSPLKTVIDKIHGLT